MSSGRQCWDAQGCIDGDRLGILGVNADYVTVLIGAGL
jgi:hypothetical protein